MKHVLLFALMLVQLSLPAQQKLIGFSESGEINAANAGGNIWEMNLDGTGFNVLKNFEIQKPVRPLGEMVFGSDGKGYGFAKGFELDAATQVFYQYDFDTQKLRVRRVFKDSLWGFPLCIASNGLLYGCRRTSDSTMAVFSLSLDGVALTPIHEFPCRQYVNGIIQRLDGSILVTQVEYPLGITLLSGMPDGSDWDTLVSFDGATMGFDISNLIQKSDGVLYGVINQYDGIARLFQILPGAQSYTVLYETPSLDFGRKTSLGLSQNEVLYVVAEKDLGQVVYKFPDTNQPPILVFSANTYGSQRTPLSRNANGDLFYLSTKVISGTQFAYIFSISASNTPVKIIRDFSFTVTVNSNDFVSLLYRSANESLYFWRVDDSRNQSDLMRCKTNGTNLTTDYATGSEISTTGAFPKKLIKGSNGQYYGFVTRGGPNNSGFVFEMNADGTGFNQICPFPPVQQGIRAIPCLFEGSDGKLYGTLGDFKVFRLNTDGSGFEYILSDLGGKSNFIEGADGMLYWGGSKLMRMAKDGSNQTVVEDIFISQFTSSDFCEIVELPNGIISGEGSYSYDDNHDFYTYPIAFSYDQVSGVFKDRENLSLRPGNATLGIDGLLYFGKGSYNPATNAFSTYDIQCAYLPNSFIINQSNDAAFQGSNGQIFGRRVEMSNTNGRWMPMAWSPEDGACKMTVAWNPDLGYRGRFAFEVVTTSTEQPLSLEEISLSPNPTHSAAQILVQLKKGGPLTIVVTDMLGRVAFVTNTSADAGSNKYEIPANALNVKGMYQVSIQTKEGVSSRMLSVQ